MGLLLSPYFLVYLLVSIVVALFGCQRKLGFWGYLFASLLLTPLLGLLLVIVSAKKPSPA
ncbi:MAG: hypothetical protein K0A93_03270 [Desulfuromonadaceae bacterium]|nr:hypothetical protein [Desulfuromonadaceae bacterium]MDT8424178.1 hypothetical protein [Desulfuromonadales bacterium]